LLYGKKYQENQEDFEGPPPPAAPFCLLVITHLSYQLFLHDYRILSRGVRFHAGFHATGARSGPD